MLKRLGLRETKAEKHPRFARVRINNHRGDEILWELQREPVIPPS
jgi:hypothetical protein